MLSTRLSNTTTLSSRVRLAFGDGLALEEARMLNMRMKQVFRILKYAKQPFFTRGMEEN
jgi:hypothetical protein